MRRPLVFVIFLVSSLVLGAIAVFGWTAVREESARPKESTQLTLRFEGVTDAQSPPASSALGCRTGVWEVSPWDLTQSFGFC